MAADTIKIEILFEDKSRAPIIRAWGEVDVVGAPELKCAMNQVIDAGANNLILDLSDVSYMDSAGFGVLLSALKRVRPQGGSISLAGCSDMMMRLLKITSLDTIFGLFPTLDEAVSAVDCA